MPCFDIISLDIFQTLVDVNEQIPAIWRTVLGDSYTDEAAYIGAEAVISCYPAAIGKALSSESFITMEGVYLDCAKGALEKTGFAGIKAQDLAFSLLYQHGFAPFYPETEEFIRRLGGRRVIICSDSNLLMAGNILSKLHCEKAYISDELKAYKAERLFSFVAADAKKEGIDPSRIIHVGDSSADISGAAKEGITSCLIDRSGKRSVSSLSVKPDYVIHNLLELFDIAE